jgi:CubicO group peptidase (beta-lactamase class C family)
MARDSILRIISMTKSFATAGVLRLRDRGIVDIDAPLSSLAPKIKLAEPFASASLRRLMAMRLDLPVDDPWADRLLGDTDADHEKFFAMPMVRAGVGASTCSYSNLSYILLGRIMREVSGQPAMDYISHEILRPLGLRDTIWNVTDEQRDRVARGYRVDIEPLMEQPSVVFGAPSMTSPSGWNSYGETTGAPRSGMTSCRNRVVASCGDPIARTPFELKTLS